MDRSPPHIVPGAVDRFYRKSYQRFFVILIKIVGGVGLDLPAEDTDVIFDHYWKPQLRTNLSPLCAHRR